MGPEVKEIVKQIQQRTGASTIVEVFRRALALYLMVLDQQAAKGKVVLEDADGTREAIRLL